MAVPRPHIIYEVAMRSTSASYYVSGPSSFQQRYGVAELFSLKTASGNNYGFAAWGPQIRSHVVYALAIKMIELPAALRIRIGLKSGGATNTSVVTIGLPTTCVSSIMHYQFPIPRFLNPGQQLVLWVTVAAAAVSGAAPTDVTTKRGVAYLLVETVMSEPTDRSQIVTYLATV